VGEGGEREGGEREGGERVRVVREREGRDEVYHTAFTLLWHHTYTSMCMYYYLLHVSGSDGDVEGRGGEADAERDDAAREVGVEEERERDEDDEGQERHQLRGTRRGKARGIEDAELRLLGVAGEGDWMRYMSVLLHPTPSLSLPRPSLCLPGALPHLSA
jgi:hypothetical protein